MQQAKEERTQRLRMARERKEEDLRRKREAAIRVNNEKRVNHGRAKEEDKGCSQEASSSSPEHPLQVADTNVQYQSELPFSALIAPSSCKERPARAEDEDSSMQICLSLRSFKFLELSGDAGGAGAGAEAEVRRPHSTLAISSGRERRKTNSTGRTRATFVVTNLRGTSPRFLTDDAVTLDKTVS
eukprot:768675-Hanusia_phi.AAC.2